MFDIELEGFDELIKKLDKIAEEIPRQLEKELRKGANRIALDAKMNCPDPKVRDSIRSEIIKSGDVIEVVIKGDPKAKPCLKKAFKKNRNQIPKEVANTIKRAIDAL